MSDQTSTNSPPDEKRTATRQPNDGVSEEQFRLIFEHAPIGIILVGAEGTILHANPAMGRVFGGEAKEYIGQPVETLLPLAARESHRLRRARYQEDPEPRAMGANRHLVGRRRDGTMVAVEVGLSPFTIGGEAVVLAFITDTTARRAAEEGNARLAAIVTGSEDAIIGKTLDGTVTSWNRGAERIFGYTAEEMVGCSILRLFPQNRLPEEQMILSQIARGEVVPHFDTVRRRKDGTLIDISVTASPIRNADGVVIGVSKCARDISESKATAARLRQMSAELEETARRFEQITNSLPQLVWTSQPDGAFDFVNQQWLDFTGMPAETQYGLGWLERLHPDDRASVYSRWQECIGAGSPFRIEYRLRRHDGVFRWFDTRATPLRDRDGRLQRWFGSNTDNTEQKEAESRRAQVERKLVEAAKAESLGVLAGGIAHDFNNLLTAVLGHASLARLELPADENAQQSLLEIENAARRAADLCRQMLAYSGQGGFTTREIDLNRFVRDALHMLEMSVGKNCALKLELDPGVLLVAADQAQLRQALANLVINASESLGARPGWVCIRTTGVVLEPAALPAVHAGMELSPGLYARLDVVDNGCGIAADLVPRIFDPFFTTKFTGRGLGLAAVHGIVRAHRGCVEVLPAAPEGSQFRLYFPRNKNANDGSAPVSRRTTPKISGLQSVILVVDDEATVRQIAARLLARLGYDVREATTGREAIETLRASPDAIAGVLLDLTMPQMDGAQTCAELRKIAPTIPVILTSGYGHEEALARLGEVPISGFVKKPFELETLAAAIHAVVGPPK